MSLFNIFGSSKRTALMSREEQLSSLRGVAPTLQQRAPDLYVLGLSVPTGDAARLSQAATPVFTMCMCVVRFFGAAARSMCSAGKVLSARVLAPAEWRQNGAPTLANAPVETPKRH